MIITSRGSYGYILNNRNESIEGNLTNLILDVDYTLIPYGGSQENGNNYEIIGVGQKINKIPTGSNFSSANENVFLILDKASQM